MLQQKTFVTKTRQNYIRKVVAEHYLRCDVYCGAPFCKVCVVADARLGSDDSTIIIVDTNVVLHQIDLLENPALNNIVVLSIIPEEVKHRNLSVYNRLRALCDNPERRFFVFLNEHHKDTYVKTKKGESRNDRNDRAIQVAARWYQNHLGSAARVLLVTNDRENKRKAIEGGIHAETIESYVKPLGQPALLDLIVQPPTEDVTMEDAEDL